MEAQKDQQGVFIWAIWFYSLLIKIHAVDKIFIGDMEVLNHIVYMSI